MRGSTEDDDEKTKSGKPNVVNKSMIESETIINNLVSQQIRILFVLNYLKSAILYTKIKHGRIYTDIFTSY